MMLNTERGRRIGKQAIRRGADPHATQRSTDLLEVQDQLFFLSPLLPSPLPFPSPPPLPSPPLPSPLLSSPLLSPLPSLLKLMNSRRRKNLFNVCYPSHAHLLQWRWQLLPHLLHPLLFSHHHLQGAVREQVLEEEDEERGGRGWRRRRGRGRVRGGRGRGGKVRGGGRWLLEEVKETKDDTR